MGESSIGYPCADPKTASDSVHSQSADPSVYPLHLISIIPIKSEEPIKYVQVGHKARI